MNRDDIEKINKRFELIVENQFERQYASATIQEVIDSLEYWVKEFNKDPRNAPGRLEDLLTYAKISVNQPKRRAEFFEDINKEVKSGKFTLNGQSIKFTDILLYLIPNFGEIEGSGFKKYKVYYPDGEVYTINLPQLFSKTDDMSSEMSFDMPEEKGNECSVDDIIDHLEEMVNPSWNSSHEGGGDPSDESFDDFADKVITLANRAKDNPKARDAFIQFIKSDIAYVIPNFSEVEGMYDTYTITFPDGDKKTFRI